MWILEGKSERMRVEGGGESRRKARKVSMNESEARNGDEGGGGDR